MRRIAILLATIIFSPFVHVSAEEHSSGGVVITFDDAHIENWQRLSEEVVDYDAVFTFYLTREMRYSDETWDDVWELKQAGHEIGAHTSNHHHLQDFVDNNGMEAWLRDEVDAQVIAFEERGFNLRTFAYPFGEFSAQVDGHGVSTIPELQQRFDVVRLINGNLWSDRSLYPRLGNMTAEGVLIDCNANVELDSLHDAIKRAGKTGSTFVMYAHDVNFESESECIEGTIDIAYLVEILNIVEQEGLSYYTMSAAHDADLTAPHIIASGPLLAMLAFLGAIVLAIASFSRRCKSSDSSVQP